MKLKKILKIAGGFLGVIILAVILLAAYLTIREYRPEAVEDIQAGNGTRELAAGDDFSILTYNIGYGGLSKEEDFFMDGGEKVIPDSKQLVEDNLRGIADIIEKQDADVSFIQEIDLDSRRSYHINQQDYFEQALGLDGIFAYNFKCDFVPYPLPPLGKTSSGIMTMTDLKVNQTSRISLPESFSWPIKTCNLKRCLLETRIKLVNTDQELVLINFHLEAYDSGAGKEAQSKMLAEKLKTEYELGNYVIAGGDFNQTFEGMDKYPIHDKNSWVPGTIGTEDIPEGFSFAVSDNVPTCRLLNGPYSSNYHDSQVYVIDGFIVSDNIEIKRVENINLDFEYTDHQPVRLEAVMKQ